MNRNGLVPSRNAMLDPFKQVFDKIFDDVLEDFSSSGLKSQKVGFPKVDVWSHDGKWVVEADVPGYSAENITVEIVPDGANNLLKISGTSEEIDSKTYYIKELKRSQFDRVIRLPDFVKGEPEATMKNGRLTLAWLVPELKPPEKKSIQIKSIDK